MVLEVRTLSNCYCVLLFGRRVRRRESGVRNVLLRCSVLFLVIDLEIFGENM